MRIRKRLPTSSIPLTDPQLNRSSPVVQLQPYPHGNLHSQPSDQPQIIISDEKSRWVSPSTSFEGQKMNQKVDGPVVVRQCDLEGKEIKEDDRWVQDDDDDIRNDHCTLNAEVDITLLLSSSSSSDHDHDNRDGRWGEGDKVVPLKKRKGSFERINKAAKWKSKTNKKCLLKNGDRELNEKIAIEQVVDNSTGGNNNVKNKKKRGNVIMEGSRCSRVNGRGWRCCQQTLVGYSLCEHHLGKGRLRSISSVVIQNRAPDKNTTIAPKIDDNDDEVQALLSLRELKQENKSVVYQHVGGLNSYDRVFLAPMSNNQDVDDDEYGKARMVIKNSKKRKVGTVKARSMSSLLGEMDNAIVLANNTSKNQ